MAISPDAIKEILYFNPGQAVVENERIELGTVDGVNVVYGNFCYQRRFIGDPEEPLTTDWTKQPAVALELRSPDGQITARIILAYATNIKAVGADLALKVADHLKALRERI